MGMFSGIGDASPAAGKGVFLTDGEYQLEVHRAKLIESKRVSKTFFIVESKILHSSSDRHPPGQLTTWLVKMGGDWPEYALADVKAFTMAASGAGEEEVDERFMEEVVSGEGRLVGLIASRDPELETPEPNDLYEVGTVAIVHRLFRAPDDTIRLVVQGVARFRAVEYVQLDPYLSAEIELIPEDEEEGAEIEIG